MTIVCYFLGHKWYGRGWTSDIFSEDVPYNHIRNLWGCSRCQARSFTDEHASDVKIRFDGYRQKHGDMVVATDEFGPPVPNAYDKGS